MGAEDNKKAAGSLTLPLRSCDGKHLFFLQIDALAKLLARFEMRDVLRRDLHLLARLRIAPGARRSIVQSEASESSDLDALSVREAFGHRIEDHLDRELGVFRDELRVARRELCDQLRLCHGTPLALLLLAVRGVQLRLE